VAVLVGAIVLASLMLENLRGDLRDLGGIQHGWPQSFMTRSNFRPSRTETEKVYESSSLWPLDGAEIKHFSLSSLLTNAFLATLLVVLTTLKMQHWMIAGHFRVRLSLKVLLMFPAICASGYLLWGRELEAWLNALRKVSFTVVVVSVGIAWLSVFDLLSMLIYRTTARPFRSDIRD
jgi:hypothetical protein